MSIANVNLETGVRYGLTNKADGLAQHIFEHGKDRNYAGWLKDAASNVATALEEIGPYDGDPDGDLYTDERLAPLVKVLKEIAYTTDVSARNHAVEAIEAVDDAGDEADYAAIAEETVKNLDDHKYEADGATYEYEDEDGNQFLLTTDRGNVVWCIRTDKIVSVRRLCSPCMPNAGDLDSGIVAPEDGYQCYGVPDKYADDDSGE